MMRIVFMGTPDFSVGSLECLAESEHEVVAVVTQPDKPKGRSGKLQISPVKEFALSKGYPVLQPVKLREEETIEKISAYKPDLIVVAAFGQILPGKLLELPVHGCINVHASLLPKYRGASPIQASILNGDEETGITIMQMDEGLDTGDILLQKSLKIESMDTAESLFNKLAFLGKDALGEALKEIEAGTLSPIPQDDQLATKTGIIKKDFGLINWSEPAVSIERMFRAFDPWPGAFTYLEDKQIKLYKGKVLEGSFSGKPGSIIKVEKDSFTVSCGENALQILELQLMGRKRMKAEDFLRGTKISEGMLLR